MSDDGKKLKTHTIEEVTLEESDEIGSIDYDDDEDSLIIESGREPAPTNPTFEVYLRIKPRTINVGTRYDGVTSSSIDDNNDNRYEISNDTTLITRFESGVSRKISRLPAVVGKRFNDRDRKASDSYFFTRIFRSYATQEELFEGTAKKRIVDFLNGRNSTIISYGTTNSGKTYTIHGTPEKPGLIPRSIDHIFSVINCTLLPWYKLHSNNTLISLDERERSEESEKKAKLLGSPAIDNNNNNKDRLIRDARRSLENSERSTKIDRSDGRKQSEDEYNGGESSMYAVWLSFAEIYNDNIYDLLDFTEDTSSRNNRPLKLIGDKNGITYVKGLTTVYVTTAFEACQILVAGQSRMSTTFTMLNPKCSRSHTIFTIGLLKYQRAYAPHETEASTLTFFDLAGSGRSNGTNGLNPTRLKEAKSINKSLLVLGRCLKSVRKERRKGSMKGEGNVAAAGPFRESKLTRMFQRALSGNEHVTFLVNIDTSSELVSEIKSILKVTSVARGITADDRTKGSNRRTFIPRESNRCCSTRIDEEGESEISNEFKSNDANKSINDGNKSIDYTEKLTLDREDHEKCSRNDLSIDDHRIDDVSRERMYGKRKRKSDEELTFVCETDDDDDDKDDKDNDKNDYDLLISKDLQAENLRAAGRIRDLENELKDLQREKLTILEENERYSSELLLLKGELNDRRDLDKTEIDNKSCVNENAAENDIDDLTIKLKNVIDEKKRFIGKRMSDLRRYDNVEDEEEAINDELNEINELRKELSDKTIDIKALTMQLETCEKELNETEVACKDAENRNVVLLRKIEALESVVRYMECERKDTYTPQPPYYLEEITPIDNEIIGSNRYEKIRSSTDDRSSSITDLFYFGDGTSEPRDMIVQAHVDVKGKQADDVVTIDDRNDFVRRDLRYVDDKNIDDKKGHRPLELSVNDIRSSDGSSKNDSGIVIEESVVDWKRSSNDTNVGNIEENVSTIPDEFSKEFEKVSKSLDPRTTYDRERSKSDESYDRSILTEEGEDVEPITRKSYRSLNVKCQSLEDLSRWLKHRLDLQMAHCRMEHLSKLTDLERDLTSKTIDLKVANEKIKAADNKDLDKLNDLTKRLNELTRIVSEFNEERKELYGRLRKRSETQLCLEKKLKYFVSLAEEKEEDMARLREDLTNIYRINATNKERIKELDSEINGIKDKMDSIGKELICSEELRVKIERSSIEEIDDLKSRLANYENNATILTRTIEDLEIKKDELIRVKTQLLRKEREMSLFKSNRDATIERYEFLIKQLQDEIDKLKDRSRYDEPRTATSVVSSIGTKKESSNCTIRTRNRFKVSESLKKLTRTGFNKVNERNWKSNYLRRKSTDERSVASTSNFSVSRVSSLNETNDVTGFVSSEDNNTKFISDKKLERTSIDRVRSYANTLIILFVSIYICMYI